MIPILADFGDQSNEVNAKKRKNYFRNLLPQVAWQES